MRGRMLGLVQVDVTERAGRADVRTRYPSGDEMRGPEPPQRQRVGRPTPSPPRPAPASPRTRSPAASAHATSRGELTLESVSGNVAIANGGRVVAAKTISGNVEITGTEIDGALDASSVSGTSRCAAARRAG